MKKSRVTNNCVVCGKEFEVVTSRKQAKFCSRKCYYAGRKQGFTTHPPRSYPEFQCRNCSKVFRVERRRYGSETNKRVPQYCSVACYNAMRGQYIRARFEETKRRRELKGMKQCEICDFDRFVELAHIIPNRHGGGFEEWNILYLCPNHHRLWDRQALNDKEFEKISLKVNNARTTMQI